MPPKVEAITDRPRAAQCNGVLSRRIPCQSMMRLRIRNGIRQRDATAQHRQAQGQIRARCPPIDCVEFIDGAGACCQVRRPYRNPHGLLLLAS